LVGFFLAIAALSVLALQATLVLHAPHRRRFRSKWTGDVAELTISEMPVEDMLK
jgi:hypothetical protein